MHHLRRIPPEELPKVRDEETDEMRPATERELLNMGLVPTGEPDLYDCAHVDGTPEPPWGMRVIKGPLSVRYGKVPPQIGKNMRRAEVFRAPGHKLNVNREKIIEHQSKRAARGRPSRIAELVVREADVEEGDVIDRDGIPPNRWRGERS